MLDIACQVMLRSGVFAAAHLQCVAMASEDTNDKKDSPSSAAVAAKNANKKQGLKRLAGVLAGVLVLLALVRYAMFTLEYRSIADKYGSVQESMTEAHVANIFEGFELERLRESPDFPMGVSEADVIKIKLRLLAEDQIRIYYAGGQVVGKQVLASKPYAGRDFPTILPGEGDKDDKAPSGAKVGTSTP